jgi:Na+-transporting NADH:ubiquinone oxidoreductase subunit C
VQRNSVKYIVIFALIVCAVCSLLVSTAASVLKEKQELNARLDKQKKVLYVSGLAEEGAPLKNDDITRFFKERIDTHFVALEEGAYADAAKLPFDPAKYDQKAALKDAKLSVATLANKAQVKRVPKYATVYTVKSADGEGVDLYVFPVEGKGLWSTLYGFIALDKDLNTIRGITFYQHGETPGLGGEVDNPTWKEQWRGKQMLGADGAPVIEVVKHGNVRAPERQVDGISGSTLTSRGVSSTVRTWLGEEGYGPWMQSVRREARP